MICGRSAQAYDSRKLGGFLWTQQRRLLKVRAVRRPQRHGCDVAPRCVPIGLYAYGAGVGHPFCFWLRASNVFACLDRTASSLAAKLYGTSR